MTEEKKEKSMEGYTYGLKMELVKTKNDYIRNTVNGRYFFARCNMIAEQILNKKILENIDGCPKTEEYMLSEYALQKMAAMNSYREAHFAKQDLIKKFKLTGDDIKKIEEEYYNGKIIREDYGENVKQGKKSKPTAEFVDSSEN